MMDLQKKEMASKKKKILLIGASGLFGLNFLSKNSNLFEIYCNINKKNIFLDQKKIKLNFKNPLKLYKQIKKIKPEIIINASGLTDIKKCEINKKNAKYVNYTIVEKLVRLSNKCKIKFLQISTDHLFNDNNKNFFSETDEKNPINNYAKTKSNAEEYIINNCKNYLIIRTNFFGWGTSYRNSISDFIIKNLSLNKRIYLNDDIYFTPVYLGNLIECINILIIKNKRGIFNISSSEKISKYMFALKLANMFGLDKKLINKKEFKNEKIFKPKNMALNNSKVKKILPKKFFNLNKNIINFKNDFMMPHVRNFYEFYPYGKHHLFHDDYKNVIDVLKSKNLTQGPKIEEFERKISKYVGSNYAVAVSSCSAGLHLACKVLGLNSKNKLLTSPNTFVSSANAAMHCNSKVEFIDIEPNTGNLSTKLLSLKLNKDKKIKVVMPVHFGGLACDMKKVHKISRSRKKTFIVEDAAHALGASYEDGSKVGSCKYSDMTVFSFHPVKSIACGEGGVVTTNNKNFYEKLKSLRSHGITRKENNFTENSNAFEEHEKNMWYYEMQDLGYHYRMTDMQAALGISQLNNLNKFLFKRKKLAEEYDKNFNNLTKSNILQKHLRKRSANHLYILLIDFKKIKLSKTKFMQRLMYLGIGTQVHYIPVPFHPFYKNIVKVDQKNIKKAIDYYEKALSIPLYYDLDKATQKKIIKTFKHLLS